MGVHNLGEVSGWRRAACVPYKGDALSTRLTTLTMCRAVLGVGGKPDNGTESPQGPPPQRDRKQIVLKIDYGKYAQKKNRVMGSRDQGDASS